MRRAARIDENQPEIVRALLDAGCSVQSLASVGLGVPDLLVGHGNVNLLLEVKDGSKAPSERALTKDEKRWINMWRGQVRVVHNVEEALLACGLSTQKAAV